MKKTFFYQLKRQGLLDPSQKAKKQKTNKEDKDLQSVPKDLEAETSYFFENGRQGYIFHNDLKGVVLKVLEIWMDIYSTTAHVI